MMHSFHSHLIKCSVDNSVSIFGEDFGLSLVMDERNFISNKDFLITASETFDQISQSYF
jgi:hypothetical protein